ncbi:response regulator [Pontiellaceae bacterium B12227]|nr:response regulator [Pontiellaceae bacterium B12227]
MLNAASQIKVLVIEDERPVRESFKLFLEDLDYTVLEADDGAQGIELFNRHKPDAVITDLRMPNIDGHAVLETLTKQSPDTPLIVASGTGNISDTVQALRLGAWDYLLKPVSDLSMLEHALTKSLDRARLLKENRNHQQHLESEVKRRTRQLTDKIEEITRFNKLAVGRERRVIELKSQINDLLIELGRKPKYKSPNLLNKESDPIE